MKEDTIAPSAWLEANQKCLMAELALLRATFSPQSQKAARKAEDLAIAERAFEETRLVLPAPSALDQLCSIFGLTRFERATLLACAGIELDSSFGAQCTSAQGEREGSSLTFSLALATLPEPHWSALTPNAPLRYWRLIELGAGATITGCPLRIDERALHFLAGVPGVDERLAGYLESGPRAEFLTPSLDALAQRIARCWSKGGQPGLPLVQLCGREISAKRSVAAHACAIAGLGLWCLPAERLPQSVPELEMLQRLWERESALSRAALLLEFPAAEAGESSRLQAARHWIERGRSPVLLSTREPFQTLRCGINLEICGPTPAEQRELWEQSLGSGAAGLNGQLDRIISHFDFGGQAIQAVCAQVDEGLPQGASGPMAGHDFSSLWQACRSQSRARLDGLAQRIASKVTWDDLVAPERTLALLREIAMHVRQRVRVYETWGFAAKSTRGLGISAMFCGPSGTGKTLAAEVLGNELGLDLYRIDLSQVVSKYIGETEKNLRRVFEAAEESGAVLLFDEADALFGKRSEVKDSHDRYANIEISYLLQRMEAYRGLAILTTNMKDVLDPAFMRRIRFIVQFPFPDAGLRADIWRRVFPDLMPTAGLGIGRLSKLNLAGGNIRNVAMNAAFLAAEANDSVGMEHLLRAARTEFAKLEKSLSEADLEGWV